MVSCFDYPKVTDNVVTVHEADEMLKNAVDLVKVDHGYFLDPCSYYTYRYADNSEHVIACRALDEESVYEEPQDITVPFKAVNEVMVSMI